MKTRPRVLINMASTLDGKINPVPALRRGPFTMSRAPEDPRRMRALRASAEAILIGATNLREDDPDLALSESEHRARRTDGRAEPYRIVVTTAGVGIAPTLAAFDRSLGGETIVLHAATMPQSRRALLAPHARLVELGERAVEAAALLAWIARELGVSTLLCEGGGKLNAELFAARAVDSLYLTLVPRILGGSAAPTAVSGAGFLPDEIPDPTLASLEQVGDEIYVRYDWTWT